MRDQFHKAQMDIQSLEKEIHSIDYFAVTGSGNWASGPDFKLDKILQSEGSGYDPVTQIYTAPFNGIYMIFGRDHLKFWFDISFSNLSQS
jgi:hypothetical protein